MSNARFDESLHPRGQQANAGQFATRTHSSPDGTLEEKRSEAEHQARVRRFVCADRYVKARDTYLRANQAAAIAVLKSRFPSATTAVFTRNWESDFEDVELSEIVDADGLDLAAGAASEEREGMADAARWVCEMGEDITAFLDLSDQDHTGWYEYRLDLTTGGVESTAQPDQPTELEDPETRAWKLLGDPSGTGSGWVGYDSLHRATVRAIKATRKESR